jgi:hypothetical protein
MAAMAAIVAAVGCGEAPTSAEGDATLAPPQVALDAAPAAPWTKQVVPLLAGTVDATATDISDNGMVVGVGYTDFSFGGGRGFRWSQAGGLKPLPVGAAVTTTHVASISDNGRYVAGSVDRTGGTDAARWTINGSQVSFTVLPRCGYARPARARDVNSAGVVVGEVKGNLAVKWLTASSCPVPLSAITDTMSTGRAINDIASIVGPSRTPPTNYLLTRCFAGDCWARINPLPGDVQLFATDVNDANLVVGRSVGWSKTRVFTWTLGTGTVVLSNVSPLNDPVVSDKGRVVWATTGLTALTTVGGTTTALALRPYGVNNCGDIVGRESQRAVRYQKFPCD